MKENARVVIIGADIYGRSGRVDIARLVVRLSSFVFFSTYNVHSLYFVLIVMVPVFPNHVVYMNHTYSRLICCCPV